jgi:hypothetical protein
MPPKGLLRRSRILGGDIGILTHFGGVEDDAADIDHDVVPRWERVLFSHRRHQKIVRKIRRRDKFDITVAHCPHRRDGSISNAASNTTYNNYRAVIVILYPEKGGSIA